MYGPGHRRASSLQRSFCSTGTRSDADTCAVARCIYLYMMINVRYNCVSLSCRINSLPFLFFAGLRIAFLKRPRLFALCVLINGFKYLPFSISARLPPLDYTFIILYFLSQLAAQENRRLAICTRAFSRCSCALLS